MSTYCHRIYEVKGPDGNWVALGRVCDNFHGFDRWRFKYSDRGFPKDSTVKRESLMNSGEIDYTYGHSYVTYDELLELAKKEKDNLREFIIEKINQQPHDSLINRVDFIASRLLKDKNLTEYNDKFNGDGQNEDCLEYFDEEFEEYLLSYEDMCSELWILGGFCESYKDNYNDNRSENSPYYYPEDTDQRIVFYFD